MIVPPADRSGLVDAIQWTAFDSLRIRFIEEAKLTAALSSFLTPVLTMEGREDSTVTGPTSDWLATSWPRTREEVGGGSSFAWMGAPEVFGRLVADWVAAEYRRVGGLATARVGTHGAGNETGGGHDRRSSPPCVGHTGRV